MQWLKLVFLLSLFILEFGCTSRLSLQEGIESFRAQDYRQAFIKLKPAAEKDQADAQYAIGYMYYYGQGIVEDRKLAWYWINRAAAHGQPDAVAALKVLSDKRF